MEVPTIEVLADDIVNYGAPEAMLFLVLLVVNPLELFEVVLDAGIEIRCLWISGMVNALQYGFHSRSNSRPEWSANIFYAAAEIFPQPPLQIIVRISRPTTYVDWARGVAG